MDRSSLLAWILSSLKTSLPSGVFPYYAVKICRNIGAAIGPRGTPILAGRNGQDAIGKECLWGSLAGARIRINRNLPGVHPVLPYD
jgi:hypothetical protein